MSEIATALSDLRDYCTHPQWELASYTASTVSRGAAPVAVEMRCSHCRLTQLYERWSGR